MYKQLLLCALALSCACASESEADDLQQVQQFPKWVKGGHPGGFQYNPGANLIALFNHSQGQQGYQRNWDHNQESFNQSSWNQYQQNQASWNQQHGGQAWNQAQGSFSQQNQGYNQVQAHGGANQGQTTGQGQVVWNQGQGYQGQDQTGWNQAQSNQAQGQAVWNQGQTNQGQGQAVWNQGQTNQGQGQAVWNQGQSGWNKGVNRTAARNTTGPVDLDVGVCYIEVPTAHLVNDPNGKIPAGNGSRPDLSVVRSCCHGYIRNIHNFRKCDPVCTHECVNALCTAPEICTCFPDHIKNLGGFCIPICPIGCQNGRCDGGTCSCKEGYKLHQGNQFCVPECRGNCGGIGNCTAPNTCECKSGYESTPDGSCKPHCDSCENGDCVSPNVCQCHKGYVKDKDGKCSSPCGPGFVVEATGGCRAVCDKCFNGDCIAPNNCQCHHGYVKENGFCVPSCSPPCGPLSRCLSPNFCETPRQDPGQVPPGPLYPSLPPPSSDNQHGGQNASRGSCSESQPCINGICIQNRCHCNTGYELDKSDPSSTRCIPFCAGGCRNGVCSAPNFCICNVGFVKDHSVKGHPTCVKRVKRSVDPGSYEKKPKNISELLTVEIPDVDYS